MRKQKRLPTRRRRAARCAAAALVLLILAQNFLHTAYLLPIQAVRPVEEQQNLQGTRIVRRQWEPEVHGWSSLFYLTASDSAMFLTGASLTARGWQPTHAGLLDCTGDRALHAAESQILQYSGPDAEPPRYGDAYYFFYGRVDDPAIETVELRLQVDAGYEGTSEETVSLGYIHLTAPIFEKDGVRYFLLYHRLPAEGQPRSGENRVIGKDRDGNTVTAFQIEQIARSTTYRPPAKIW